MPRLRDLTVRMLPAVLAALAIGCGGEDPAPTCDSGCAIPPPALCDGDTRISFMPGGECVDGACVFPPILTDCSADGGSCESGACVGPPPDPCDDVTCDAPDLEPTCDGTVVVRAETPGTCNSDDGSCSYAEERIDCADFREVCVEGECRSPGNPCLGVVCDEAPRDDCDGEIALRYGDEGVCDPQTLDCIYEPEEVDCAASGAVCSRGQCVVPDLCEGVTCDEPPADFCETGQLTSYARAGRCVEGDCEYTATTGPCPDGTFCVDGECVEPDPCDGVLCNRPPPPVCSDDLTLVQFRSPGTCTDGFCVYEPAETDCESLGRICDDGACFDAGPCFEVTCLDPPEPTCDGTTAVEYSGPGVCELGVCQYDEVRTACGDTGGTCVDGECVDACTGVVCGERRDPECIDEVTLLRRIGASECVAGECQWTRSVETECDSFGAVCEDGECVVPDPCDGVECPANDDCRGEFRLIRSGPGLCVEGVCDYSSVESFEDCRDTDYLCDEGTCVQPGAVLGFDDLVIVEFMPTPSSESLSDQWIEFYYRGSTRVSLGGMELVNGAGQVYRFADEVAVDAFSSVAVGGSLDIGDDIAAAWPPSAFSLDPAGDTLVLRYGDTEITRVVYTDEWPYSVGASAQLTAGALDGADPRTVDEWCPGTFPYGDTDAGSPGFRNAFCPL